MKMFGQFARFVCIVLLVSAAANADKEEDKAKDREEKKEKYGTIIGIDLGTTYSW